jgi:hypothetical protein
MQQLSACTAHAGRSGNVSGALTSADAEYCMERFLASVHILLVRHLGEGCALAVSAYDLGMATGFYGRRSALTVGLRPRYEAARCGPAAGGAGQSQAAAEGLLHAGYRHGRDMLAWMGAAQGKKIF